MRTTSHAKILNCSRSQRDTTSTATKASIEALGRKAHVYTADIAVPEQVAALTPKVLADGHQVRILVNCAGIQRRHPCEKFPDSDFNEVHPSPPQDLMAGS